MEQGFAWWEGASQATQRSWGRTFLTEGTAREKPWGEGERVYHVYAMVREMAVRAER